MPRWHLLCIYSCQLVPLPWMTLLYGICCQTTKILLQIYPWAQTGASDFATFAKNQNTIFMLNIPLLDAYLVYLCHTYLFNHLFSIFMLYIPLLDIIWFWRRWQKKGPFRTPDFDSCPW